MLWTRSQRRQRRKVFVETQNRVLDGYFKLAQHEESTRIQFERLTTDTYDELTAAGNYVTAFRPYTNLPTQWVELLSDSLLKRWDEWKGAHQALLDRNPRLELLKMMHDIGETHQRASWPNHFEEAIQDWIDSGEINEIPFDDANGIITPEFYSRLRELRKRIRGWLYWRDIESGDRFSPGGRVAASPHFNQGRRAVSPEEVIVGRGILGVPFKIDSSPPDLPRPPSAGPKGVTLAIPHTFRAHIAGHRKLRRRT